MSESAAVPLRWVGPIVMTGSVLSEALKVPMATYETTLWPSTSRGAKITRQMGGVNVTVVHTTMSRSIVMQAPSAAEAVGIINQLSAHHEAMIDVVKQHSRFCQLQAVHPRIVGDLIYLRLAFTTGDASGHNMVTLASQHIQHYLLTTFTSLKYVSLSANYCVDKKTSAVNGILGRGKYVVAEGVIPRQLCQTALRTTPEAIVDLNTKKNFIGSTIAGGVHTANAHYANLLLATYLATGQDAANIVEGSQGITYTEVRDNGLYFSVTLPNIIVGTVGHGKGLAFVKENLEKLGCLAPREPGENACRLAAIIAATVWCGELSLMGALTHPEELMRAHEAFERKENKVS